MIILLKINIPYSFHILFNQGSFYINDYNGKLTIRDLIINFYLE